MSDFRLIEGFEDLWRPPVRPGRRTPQSVLDGCRGSGAQARAKLTRLVNRAPEVMVKVTGRTRDRDTLRAHLNYISRNGALEVEDRDGAVLTSRAELADKADAWDTLARSDRRRRTNSPLSHSIMLSMPAGADPYKVRDAARAFAAHLFADEHDYLFALHTDTPRPHVHLSIRSRGDTGTRLNPRKPDLELWRQTFAQALRDRGVDAEATPRRARGVTRKSERAPIWRMRTRAEGGNGAMGRTQRSAYHDAAKAAFLPADAPPVWEIKLLERQRRIRSLYLRQAQLLIQSPDPADQALGVKVDAFVRAMPTPDTQRLALARELRAANARLHAKDTPDRDRTR